MTRTARICHAMARAGAGALPLLVAVHLSAAAQGLPPPGDGPAGSPDMAMHGRPGDGPPPAMAMRGHPGDGPRPDGMHGPGPLGELAQAEADQVASQAIATLAKAPLLDVQRMVRAWGVPTVLRYYDVPPHAFHDAAAPGLVAVVRAAAQQQQISATDADRIVSRLQHEGPPPPPPPPQ